MHQSSAEIWRRNIPRRYQTPTLLANRGLAADFVERIPFESLRSRLLQASGGGTPLTWLVSGGPATGKSSLCAVLAMALAEAGTPCVVINRRILDVHGAANADHIGLLRRLRPAAVAEKKWKSDLKHGRIIVIVDGLNEIRLRYGRETLWKAVEQIVIGNHPCPVMATTRALGDMDDWVALRSIELMELRPFADEEVDAFLSDAGLDVGAARSAIEDAGLTEPATNPLVLSHIVDLLLSPGDVGTKLPRSRAGVLMRTFEHVAEKRGLIDLKRGQAPVELAPAIAAAAALCVIFDPQSAETGRDLRFNLAELHSLLALSWPDAVQPDWTNLLTDMHLARMVTAAAGNEAEFAHQTLIDLAVALLFRGRELPDFLILDRPDLAQTIGDWVGLHADPELAVNQAIDFAQRHYRPDLLVDVAAANDGILTPAQREMLWAAIGVGLAGSRRMRDRTADRLAELSTSLARSAIGFGLFSTISKDEDLTAETRTLLLSRRLNARSFKRALQLSTWRRRRSRKDKMTHSSGRFGTLDRDALVDILQRATLQQKRGAAAKALGVLGDRSAVSALCAALQDEAPSVRGSAATALGALGDSSAVSVLCTALQDEAPGVRGSAATALGALGDSSAVSVLCTALQDEAPGVRGSAATALGALGNSSAVSVLCAALQDEATNVRGSAATALGALGDRSAVSVLCTALQDEASNVRGSAATALGALGDRSAVSVLCAALQDDALNVRGSAATALGALGDRGAVTALCATLADGDAGVRGSAATALGALGDRSAVSELCAALTDGDAGVRGSAATALGALGDRSAVSALCAVLTDGDASVRGSATTALGALGDRSAVSALCSVLTDGDAGVRGAAAKALGTLGDRRALPPLYVRLGDDDAHVRSSTCLALGALADRGAVQPLCAALMDSDPFVRGSAASALGTLGDSEAVEALSALLADSEGQVRLSAVNALGVLISHQTIEGAISRLIVDAKHNSESSVRTSAVITLARNGRIDLPLVRYLLDPDFKRRDGRLRDTEWGVQGQTAAAVLHAYEKSVPDGEQLMIVARLLNEPDARREVVSAALAPLGDLPAPALRRALPHLAMYLPNPPSQVAARISQLQDKLAKYKQAERSLAELRSAPVKALRVAFPPTPRPWFETTTEPLYLAKKESSTLPRTAVILTAAPIEAKAVYQSLMDREVHLGEARVAGHVVDEGMLNVAGNSWRVVLAQPLLKGPHSMQSLVKDVLSELRPEIILMVGMCGGIRENRATEGAVIVAKQVLNYEPQRLRQNDRTLNPSNYRCDPRILGCVNALSRRGVLDRIGGDGEPAIEVLTKDIGSGEKLIDDLNSAERASIVALSGDMVGVEQEAHGLYHPLWEEPLRGAPPPYAMIKGISDLADGSMLEDKLARQTRATKRALAVALAIIQNFEPPLSSG